MLKKELQEIQEIEEYINQLTIQDGHFSELKEDFFHNSERFTSGEIQANLLPNISPQEKLMSLLEPAAQNSYEELEELDFYIHMMQDRVSDFSKLKKQFLIEREEIKKSGLETDCLQELYEQYKDKNTLYPGMQRLFMVMDKEEEKKPLYEFLDLAFAQLERLHSEMTPRAAKHKLVEVNPTTKIRLKNIIELYTRLSEMLPSLEPSCEEMSDSSFDQQ